MIKIDGSYGEGGGQILRTAVSLSTITKKPVRIVNIRANRPRPGLRYQHIIAIKSVAELSNAEVKGVKKGSKEIEFHPNGIKGGKYHFDILTAGSTTLVLQACLLPSFFASEKTEFTITGGTDVKWAPPVDYFRFVYVPLLYKMGASVNIVVRRRGHYPKGGGEIVARVKPAKKFLTLSLEERCALKSIKGIAHISNLPQRISKRMTGIALLMLAGRKNVRIFEEHYPPIKDPAPGVGVGMVLWANYENTILGANGLGERGVPAERIGQNAVENLITEMSSRATLDVHATDQVLPFMALADGESVFLTRELTDHAKTNMWLIEQFLDMKFEVTKEDGMKVVSVKGVG